MPDASTVQTVAQLGGTVFTAVSFLVYLYLKNGRDNRSHERVASALEAQTRTMVRFMEKYGLPDEANDLTKV